MIKSMTGFGKADCQLSTKKVFVEIKSLNNKQTDINTKIPLVYKEKEIEIRNLLNKKLERGKIEFVLYYEFNQDVNSTAINQGVVKNYFAQFQKLSNDLNLELSSSVLETIVRLPDALKIEKEEIDETEWIEVKRTIEEAIVQLDNFRICEGKVLIDDITNRVNTICNLLEAVKPYEEERITKIKNRINNNLEEYIKAENIDKDRFEQEVIFYLEKYDITEEKVRLQNHCNYFNETVQDCDVAGKKLGFISQEMGREINTLGSKANHSEIQKLVVQMKDELEKIKEQLMNIL